jgi:hypothetical protein
MVVSMNIKMSSEMMQFYVVTISDSNQPVVAFLYHSDGYMFVGSVDTYRP